MADVTQQLETRRTGPAFGTLILTNAVVWAATLFGVTVATRLSDNVLWLIVVMVAGWMLSGAAIESARRKVD